MTRLPKPPPTPAPPSIPRKQSPAPATSFERLRDAGIEYAQELSGDLWTDFNTHDPGVTILEQLCYALTELIYQTSSDVSDHLAGPGDTFDASAQALHPAPDVLPCRPTTARDYRLLLLDALPAIDDVQVRHHPSGVYDCLIAVHTEASGSAALPPELANEVRAVFNRHRNLCEDLDDVIVAKSASCRLHASIEVSGPRSAENVLAEIYDLAATYVATGELRRPHAEEAGAPQSTESFFTGPPRERWRVATRESFDRISVADLNTLIKSIDGVSRVIDLWLTCDDPDEPPEVRGSLDRLENGCVRRLEVTAEAETVAMSRNGRSIQVRPYWHTTYRERRSAWVSRRSAKLRLESLYAAPEGQYIEPYPHHSVRHHFPSAYGINDFGVPPSAPPEVKAGARQLRGYLLPLDQLMANFQANLRHVRELFSTEDASDRTYQYQRLKDVVDDGGELCADTYEEDVVRTIAGADDYAERKGRAIDHMLATYGETFGQESLRLFYPTDGESTAAAVLRNKERFLREVATVGRDRAGAVDYTRPSWSGITDDRESRVRDNVSGFRTRLGLLLGIDRYDARTLAVNESDRGLEAEGLHIVEHILLRPTDRGPRHWGAPKALPSPTGSIGTSGAHPFDFYPHRLSVFFPAWTRRAGEAQFRQLAEETVRSNTPAHVLAEIHWLGFYDMIRFEALLRPWVELRSDARARPSHIDRAALDLIRFMTDLAEQRTPGGDQQSPDQGGARGSAAE